MNKLNSRLKLSKSIIAIDFIALYTILKEDYNYRLDFCILSLVSGNFQVVIQCDLELF